MVKIDIKPLSVNEAWKGRRFKTDKYKKYQNDVLSMLPNIKLPEPPFEVIIHYYFSNNASDIDNPTKIILDIMQKKYKFNDSIIHKLTQTKQIVKNGKECFLFEINTYSKWTNYKPNN